MCVIHRFTNAYEESKSSIHELDSEVVNVFGKEVLAPLSGI